MSYSTIENVYTHYHQLDAIDSGPTCLRMIAKHYGKHYSLETLRQILLLLEKVYLCLALVMQLSILDFVLQSYDFI